MHDRWVNRRAWAALWLVACMALPCMAKAASFDPGADWRTIRTKRFSVHYAERIEEVAQRSARILEEIYPKVTEKWGWEPWGPTEVVLVDNTDESNGLSSVLPYNWMLIQAAPPAPDSSLAHYDDWLRMLLIHEFTHVVQIDAHGGIWRPIRFLLGKTVAPSGINPMWMREGMAEYDETIFTKGGRGRGSFSEMVVRSAILEDKFPAIDEADGLGWRWPGYKGAYVYGIEFIEWLVEAYGEEKFLKFDRRVRSSLMLTMINHHARNVYGKTFYELWDEWKGFLENKYAPERSRMEAGRDSGPEEIVGQVRDEQYDTPALSPDGRKLLYSVTSPHGKAEIRMKDLSSGTVTRLKKGQDAGQFSWSPDGTKVAYSSLGSVKRYNRYYDLWLYEFEADGGGGKAVRLTSGERARDPDFDRSGRSILYVAGDMGTDRLKSYDVEKKEISALAADASKNIQYANPRYSPDGKYIAVSIWKPGDGWRIYRLNSDGTNPVRLTRGAGLAIESRPAWDRDARSVIFSSDESGLSNLYRVSADGGGAERITDVSTGVFGPALAHDGHVIAQRYSSTGFDIVRLPYQAAPDKKAGRKGKGAAAPKPVKLKAKAGHLPRGSESADVSGAPAEGAPAEGAPAEGAPAEGAARQGEGAPAEPFKSGKYIAFGKSLFLPRFILPNAAYDGNTFFASLATGGADVLRWHGWMASATYRSDARYFGYGLAYRYNRFRPLLGLALTDYAVNFGNLSFRDVNDVIYKTVHFFERRRAYSAFFAVPIGCHAASLAYFLEDHMAKTDLTADEKDALNLGNFAGFRADYRYGDAEKYSASISPENGRGIRLTGSITNAIFGSAEKNEQVIFSGDWREYIRLGGHHVAALRGAGGMTWGDPVVQGTFGLGGALGEGSFGGGGSFNYFPLRGLPVSALSGTRAMLFSGEYRFPLIAVLRGIGTVPFFLKGLSGALFADYGNAWYAHDPGSDGLGTFFDRFLLGVGAELRADFVIGHGLPVHGRLGYAVIVLNRSRLGALTDPIMGSSIRNGMLVLTLGTAF